MAYTFVAVLAVTDPEFQSSPLAEVISERLFTVTVELTKYTVPALFRVTDVAVPAAPLAFTHVHAVIVGAT